MNLQEFESQYRDAMDETLNQLQTLNLLVVRIQDKIAEVSHSVQSISQTVEEFIAEQRGE